MQEGQNELKVVLMMWVIIEIKMQMKIMIMMMLMMMSLSKLLLKDVSKYCDNGST